MTPLAVEGHDAPNGAEDRDETFSAQRGNEVEEELR